MKTKIKLTIQGVTNELDPDCLKNWDDVMCTYKRSDFSGIVRSFTSKFEFFGAAYDFLLAQYLANGYDADVKVSVWTMGNDWTYAKRFESTLDFSTVQIQDGIFSISAIDNSVSSLIKANKGTKYEMVVGTDIHSDGVFHFDRIPMTESVTYGFTYGTSEEDTGAINVHFDSEDGDVIWLGSVANEICVGGFVYYTDDQEDNEDGYMIEAQKGVDVHLRSTVVADATVGSENPKYVYAQQIGTDGTVVDSGLVCVLGEQSAINVGEYASLDALLVDYPEHSGSPAEDGSESYVAVIDGIVWRYVYLGWQTGWQCTGEPESDSTALQKTYAQSKTFHLSAGDKIRTIVDWGGTGTAVSARILSSSIKFTWTARGEACHIPAMRPLTVLNNLLGRMCAGKANCIGKISGHDERLASTILVAAEDIRGITGAKFYSSFSEFCDWMEAVFGYTYRLGASYTSPLSGSTIEFGGWLYHTPSQSSGTYPTEYSASNVKYCLPLGRFVLVKDGYWFSWDDEVIYHRTDGTPRVNNLFSYDGRYFYFDASDDTHTPIEYYQDPDDKFKQFQVVEFVHRTELFDAEAPVVDIPDVTDVMHSVDSSSIYSSVQIGYESKDYDSVNGRDEFNFNNTYTTGSCVSTKKLSLLSKYRADSYGMEFAAEKRNEDSTDSDSDSDVFCVHATIDGMDYYPDRSANIIWTLNNDLFNGALSPLACVLANAGYIGMQSSVLTLKFASSTGNNDIRIDGVRMSADITLDKPMLTLGKLEFLCKNIELPDVGSIIRVEKNGLRFTGYISEVEEPFAREEAIKYKLLLKSIEPC